MKPEEIEKRITDAPKPKLPAVWRSEILATANAALNTNKDQAPARPSLAIWIWRELVMPLRHGWSALAALWIVLLGAQFLTSSGDSSSPRSTSNPQTVHREQQELHEQRQLLAELLDFDEQKTDQKKPALRPRSQSPSQPGSA